MWESDRRRSAIVVEDNEHVRYLVEHMLVREGFDVTALPDGRQAVDFISSSAPVDIVILDLMLPHLDGFEITQLMRAHPRWRAVPIIMLSGRTQDEDIVRALEVGANDYVCKPVSLRELLARIKLRMKEAREAAEF